MDPKNSEYGHFSCSDTPMDKKRKKTFLENDTLQHVGYYNLKIKDWLQGTPAKKWCYLTHNKSPKIFSQFFNLLFSHFSMKANI